MPKSLLDMVGPYSQGGMPANTIPIPGEEGFQVNTDPGSYSPGASMSGMNDIIYSYNPQGQGGSGGAPMQLASDFQYGGGFNGGNSGGGNAVAGQTPDWWKPYQSRDTSTGGGMFTLMDLFKDRPGGLPNQFQAGADLPSTNNWRLIPNPEYRKPGFILRNGHVINTQMMGNDVGGGQPAFGAAGADLGGMARINIGSGAGYGYPAMGHKNVFWPGQVERAMQIGGGNWE